MAKLQHGCRRCLFPFTCCLVPRNSFLIPTQSVPSPANDFRSRIRLCAGFHSWVHSWGPGTDLDGALSPLLRTRPCLRWCPSYSRSPLPHLRVHTVPWNRLSCLHVMAWPDGQAGRQVLESSSMTCLHLRHRPSGTSHATHPACAHAEHTVSN